MNRRGFLIGAAATCATAAAAARGFGAASDAALLGTVDASEFGVRPAPSKDASRSFQRMLDAASDRDLPVHLPAGTYVVSNIRLPKRVRLSGVSGATRIVYGGNGHLFVGEDAERVEFENLVLDGAHRWLDDGVPGLLALSRVAVLNVDRCDILDSGRNGISLEACAGRIERTFVGGAADAAVYAVESRGLAIVGNRVADCGNGGILVHRWQPAEDGTIVSGNRVERIGARDGGTGQHGNGINVFRADNVSVQGNQVSDCAFSAIRANSAGNIQIGGNTCLRSGETGIYSEFSFVGAAISSNIVDGAANGISVVNFNEGGRMAVVSGNLVRNLTTEGPYKSDPPGFGTGIAVEADTTVTGNVVEGAPLYGMHFGWGEFMRNVVATGNVVRDCGEGIAVSVVEGTGQAIISDNVFDRVPGGAVVGHRWREPVTGDLTKGGADAFPGLIVERNRVS